MKRVIFSINFEELHVNFQTSKQMISEKQPLISSYLEGRPSIFVSSTIDSLPNERSTAHKVISELGYKPLMSEKTFIAENTNSIDLCLRLVAESDLFIVLIGPKYGFELESGESICEKEYLTALQFKKPVIAFNLVSYLKDEKQSLFLEKVQKKYFCKPIKDTYELERELKNSIDNELSKSQKNTQGQGDNIFTNLAKILFPEKIFISKLNIDRESVIKNSATTGKHLLRNASERLVVYSAMEQNGVESRPSDWVVKNKQIITFQNLKDPKNPLRTVLDIGTIEELTPHDYYSVDSDRENIFRELLHHCFQRKAFAKRILWNHEEKLFFFVPINEGDKERIETWVKHKRATRTVYEEKWYNGKLNIRKHLAFSIRFYHFNNTWYIMILPDWYFSWHEYKKSRFGAQKIKYLKKVEKNKQVLNHFEFFLYILKKRNDDSLFEERGDYDVIQIGDILRFQMDYRLDDAQWHHDESPHQRSLLLNDDSGFFTEEENHEH